MDRRDLRMLLALVGLSLGWLVVQGVAGLDEGFAMLVPAMLLALPLLAGRYLGERTIERVRLARSVPRAGRRRLARASALPRPAVALVPRGGLLLASSLATRPPPVSA